MTKSPEISAALERWTWLAAFAWDRYLGTGRGIVVIDRDELLAPMIDGRPTALEPSYVPEYLVPPGDDFRALVLQYDPRAQLLLMTRDAQGEEMLLALKAEDRPGPEACFRSITG